MRTIVLLTTYPTLPEQQKDGYFQRVLEIDGMLQDLNRIYVDFSARVTHGPEAKKISDKISQITLNEGKKSHWLTLAALFLRHRLVYSHSILRLEPVVARLGIALPGVRFILDVHGVVPEEFRYHDDYLSGQRFDEFEALGIQNASHVIVVSRAMGEHLIRKYGSSVTDRLIPLPIFSSFEGAAGSENLNPVFDKKYNPRTPKIIYAGGTHKWQQLPKALDAVEKGQGNPSYQFFVPDAVAFRKVVEARDLKGRSVSVDSVKKEELAPYYQAAHFGFILREDCVVNRVACPTKLIEYLQFGIVPIVDSPNIGDFLALGMRSLSLAQLMAGDFPDAQEFRRMQQHNFGVLRALDQLAKDGKEKLIGLFRSPERKPRQPLTVELSAHRAN